MTSMQFNGTIVAEFSVNTGPVPHIHRIAVEPTDTVSDVIADVMRLARNHSATPPDFVVKVASRVSRQP